jgi:hypothetical protein
MRSITKFILPRLFQKAYIFKCEVRTDSSISHPDAIYTLPPRHIFGVPHKNVDVRAIGLFRRYWRKARPPSAQCRSCTHPPPSGIRGAMPRKAKPPTDRAADQADYKTWLADAVAALQREHNINPSIIPMRVWRHLHIQGRSPQKAGERLQQAVGCGSAAEAATSPRRWVGLGFGTLLRLP